MTSDLKAALEHALPDLRGTLAAGQPLSELTWFRVGGPAEVADVGQRNEVLQLLGAG